MIPSTRRLGITLLIVCHVAVIQSHEKTSKKDADDGGKQHRNVSKEKSDTKGLNILFVAPFGSTSHKYFYDGVIEAIADGGHKVNKNAEQLIFQLIEYQYDHYSIYLIYYIYSKKCLINYILNPFLKK